MKYYKMYCIPTIGKQKIIDYPFSYELVAAILEHELKSSEFYLDKTKDTKTLPKDF